MIRYIAASLALLLALTGIAFAGPPAVGANANLNLNVDVVAMGQAIAAAVQTAQNREAFVKDSLERMISTTRGQHYVMVFNLRQGYEFTPRPGTFYYKSANYGGITYGIWVFRGPVVFRNLGDGGWINWGFYGGDRNGNTVVFR